MVPTVVSGNLKANQQTLRMIQGSAGMKAAVYKINQATQPKTPPNNQLPLLETSPNKPKRRLWFNG